MLRSWTRRLSLENDLSIGIAISRNSVCAAKIKEQDGKPNVIWIKQTTIDQPLFEHDDIHPNSDALSKALKTIVNSLDNRSSPIHVALPDTVIKTSTFELDDLPKSNKTLSSLAQWKMADNFGRIDRELVCRTLSLGTDNGKHLLYAQAGYRYWIEHITSSFNACGIVPWTINSASHFRHNYLNSQGIAPASTMLSVDDDCWTLQLWDSDARIRLTLTRLRRILQSRCDEDFIINELVRVLRAWRVNHPDLTLDTLYLDGSKEIIGRLIEHPLDIFKKTIPMKLDVAKPEQDNINESPLATLATMAAVTE